MLMPSALSYLRILDSVTTSLSRFVNAIYANYLRIMDSVTTLLSRYVDAI